MVCDLPIRLELAVHYIGMGHEQQLHDWRPCQDSFHRRQHFCKWLIIHILQCLHIRTHSQPARTSQFRQSYLTQHIPLHNLTLKAGLLLRSHQQHIISCASRNGLCVVPALHICFAGTCMLHYRVHLPH